MLFIFVQTYCTMFMIIYVHYIGEFTFNNNKPISLYSLTILLISNNKSKSVVTNQCLKVGLFFFFFFLQISIRKEVKRSPKKKSINQQVEIVPEHENNYDDDNN